MVHGVCRQISFTSLKRTYLRKYSVFLRCITIKEQKNESAFNFDVLLCFYLIKMFIIVAMNYCLAVGRSIVSKLISVKLFNELSRFARDLGNVLIIYGRESLCKEQRVEPMCERAALTSDNRGTSNNRGKTAMI